MRKSMKFRTLLEYSDWAASIELTGVDPYLTPVLIECKDRTMADLTTVCHRWTTALNRFNAALGTSAHVRRYISHIRSECEKGVFSGGDSMHCWGVEEEVDNAWHVYLNVKGGAA